MLAIQVQGIYHLVNIDLETARQNDYFITYCQQGGAPWAVASYIRESGFILPYEKIPIGRMCNHCFTARALIAYAAGLDKRINNPETVPNEVAENKTKMSR
jgi:hypothetical protein